MLDCGTQEVEWPNWQPEVENDLYQRTRTPFAEDATNMV